MLGVLLFSATSGPHFLVFPSIDSMYFLISSYQIIIIKVIIIIRLNYPYPCTFGDGNPDTKFLESYSNLT